MQQFQVEGTITYLKFCPKAPGVHLCEPPTSCDGHAFMAAVDLFVDAPDADRAIQAALGKLKPVYPWPLFADGEPNVTLILPGLVNHITIERGPQLPGFDGI